MECKRDEGGKKQEEGEKPYGSEGERKAGRKWSLSEIVQFTIHIECKVYSQG